MAPFLEEIFWKAKGKKHCFPAIETDDIDTSEAALVLKDHMQSKWLGKKQVNTSSFPYLFVG